MPDQVTNYKCPACTGPLHFVGASGKLECDYCGSTYEVKEIEALYAEQEAKAAAAQQAAEEKEAEAAAAAAEHPETDGTQAEEEMGWDVSGVGGDWGEDAAKMRAYTCPSCGAQLICDETTAATSCPYCGNPTVVPGQFGGTLRPDFVLPFKLSREDAIKALKQHYKGKILLPKAFTAENHIQEIKGVYVPFWLFDGEASVNMSFSASNSYTSREGDYRVTRTKHYDIRRSGTIGFEKVPVDGSSKMPDDFMDSIEPYDYKDLKEFSTAYLPGFLADKYDVDAEAASKRADSRCKNTAVDSVRRTVHGYSTVIPRSQRVRLERGEVKYALLPVWMLSTKWKDKNYLFAMNGQTGKMVGDLPTDKGKFHLWFWSTAVGASAVLSLLFSGPLGRLIGGLFA